MKEINTPIISFFYPISPPSLYTPAVGKEGPLKPHVLFLFFYSLFLTRRVAGWLDGWMDEKRPCVAGLMVIAHAAALLYCHGATIGVGRVRSYELV